ncbi:MAG: transglycosylase domain-containing protein [Rikenella sp.]|nr:transglycosylase domain-containing protein [Rikenella sp.]
MVRQRLARIRDYISDPVNHRRISLIFWSILIIPPVLFGVLLFLIGFGVFGKLPTFEELENPRSNLATELISADGKNIGSYFVENRSYVDYGDLSPNLVAALVATEDARFYSHSGIDFQGLARVGIKTVLLGDRGQGGGSTISQQLAKNLYPRDTTHSSGIAKAGKLVIAKLKEWITAVMLEHNYTKEEIMAMYLNTVEYGSNAYGIKSASATFFNKSPDALAPEEAALLVGVVNAPTRYSPKRNPERALRRRNTVLERMGSAGFLTKAEVRELTAKPIQLDYHPVSHNEGTATYFREMLRLYMTAEEPKRRQFLTDWDYEQEMKRWQNDPLYGWCNKNTKADGTPYNLYKDGLKIYTTINSRMQQYAEEAVEEHLSQTVQPLFDRQRKAYKTIFYDIQQSEQDKIMRRAMLQSDRGIAMKQAGFSEERIRAEFGKPVRMSLFSYGGNRDTLLSPRDSILHMKSFLRAGFMAMDPATGYVTAYVGGSNFRHFKYDMVRQGKRQVGSTIKPFIYTFAFDMLGYNPCTLVPNSPVTIETVQGPWSPKEAGEVEQAGELRPLYWGLANSRNNYSAWIMKQAQPQAVADMIHKVGIGSYIDPVYALCVGTPQVSVFEMTGAFSTFANRGVYTEPFFVTRIEDKQGNVLASFSPQTHDAISEQTAYTMLEMLKQVVKAGTAGRLRYQFNLNGDVGGKTGTTNNNADAWFMGVTPQVVAGTWVGGEDPATHLLNAADGSRIALPIFGIFMTKVYKDKSLGIGIDDRFMEPIGVVKYDCDPQQVVSAESEGTPGEGGSDEFFQ